MALHFPFLTRYISNANSRKTGPGTPNPRGPLNREGTNVISVRSVCPRTKVWYVPSLTFVSRPNLWDRLTLRWLGRTVEANLNLGKVFRDGIMGPIGQGRIVQGTEHPRLFVRGHFVTSSSYEDVPSPFLETEVNRSSKTRKFFGYHTWLRIRVYVCYPLSNHRLKEKVQR